MSVFKDKDIVTFYYLEVGISLAVTLVAALQSEWLLCVPLSLIALGFLICGPPLRAEIIEDGSIMFKGPIRRTKITANSLVKVKAIGANDYRAHIVLRNKHGFPVMYRNRKYENAPVLARAVLHIIEKSTNVKATKDALKLLNQTAKKDRKS